MKNQLHIGMDTGKSRRKPSEQRGHGSPRESRGERCEDRKGFPRWGKSLSFVGTYLCPGHTTLARLKKLGELLLLFQLDLISCKEPRDIVFIQELIQLGEICFNDCINLSNK